MSKQKQYVFIDESGDPGKPFKIVDGEKIPTGASTHYILAAICLNSSSLSRVGDMICQIKRKYKYRDELKSITIPLSMYAEVLELINDLKIPIFYRFVDKETYKGTFAVDNNKKLHNVFDEYNLAKTVSFATKQCQYLDSEIVIDRTDRRKLDGNFDNINGYIISKSNTKTIRRVSVVTHVSSEYVYAMQLSDLVCGAIKNSINGDKSLLSTINKKNLNKVY